MPGGLFHPATLAVHPGAGFSAAQTRGPSATIRRRAALRFALMSSHGDFTTPDNPDILSDHLRATLRGASAVGGNAQTTP